MCRRCSHGFTFVELLVVIVVTLGMIIGPLTNSDAATIVAFFDDFDGGYTTAPGVAAHYSGITATESVQGYAGLGTGSNSFSGKLLRNQTGMAFPFGGVPASPVIRTILQLENLPQHQSIDLNFLFAAIDSWDGNTINAAPDLFNVLIDGVAVFSNTIDNFDLSDQTYNPPPGVLLSQGIPLGFNSRFTDSAYNVGLDPAFDLIPHSASELTIEWFASGVGWTAAYFEDESWGIDNIEVRLHSIPEPGFLALLAPTMLSLLNPCRRRRAAPGVRCRSLDSGKL